MGDDKKCRLLKKAVKGTYYYKCEARDCDNECFIYVLWEYINEKFLGPGKDGKPVVQVDGFNVLEVGCECMKFDRWDGGPDRDKPCGLQMGVVPTVPKKDGKKTTKTVVHCVATKDCKQECVVVHPAKTGQPTWV